MAKYNHVRDITLKEDNNEYQVGVYGSGMNKKFDFYINDELKFKEIPFRKGNSITVLKSGYFINVRDSHGYNRVIRDGEIVLNTRYHVVNAHVLIDCDSDGEEFISDTFLIVASRNDGLKGVYSTNKRKLVLPFKYSTIDIDEHFYIILGQKVNLDEYDEELKNDMLKSIRKGEYMQIGDYSVKHNWVSCKAADVYDDKVWIVREWNEYYYYWNDGFIEEIEDSDDSNINVPSNWEDYSCEDSLYDALGGQMDAIWNID